MTNWENSEINNSHPINGNTKFSSTTISADIKLALTDSMAVSDFSRLRKNM
jgi:hypothetical protein